MDLEAKIREAEMVEAVLLNQIKQLATYEQKELINQIEEKYGIKREQENEN
jgi:hypothetical protein